MSLIVQKFGGSSLATPHKIKKVAKRIAVERRKGHQIVVVASACGDTTDNLVALARKISPQPDPREMDMLMSSGEQISIALLSMALKKEGINAISLTGAQAGIQTNNSPVRARILRIAPQRIQEELQNGKVVVVAGFQGVNKKADITTLGRGGSDTTAVALAAALKSDKCEIYTDVEGIYSADPQIVPQAKKLAGISCDEMLEMACLGAKVMHPRAVEIVRNYGVKLEVKSSFNNRKGTMIMRNFLEKSYVTGVTVNKNEAKITLVNVPDRPGISARIFQAIARANINVDIIVQNVSRKGITDLSFTLDKNDLALATQEIKKVAREIKAGVVLSDKDMAKVSIIGAGMYSYPGVAARMFTALGKAKINIEMISTSEIKVSCVIKKEKADLAVKVLHKEFQLEK